MFELRCSVSNALANGQRVLFVPGGLFLVSTRRTANRPGKSPCAQDFEEKLSVVALACSFVLAWAAAVASATRLRVSLFAALTRRGCGLQNRCAVFPPATRGVMCSLSSDIGAEL